MASTASTTYVNALYTNLIGFSDPAGAAAWATQIDAGTSPYNVANAFLDVYQTSAAPVALLYQAALGRLPDYDGFAYWLTNYKTVSAGNPLLLSKQFYDSAEFALKVGGDPTNLAASDYVQKLYTNVLGRPGDFDGVTYWTKVLTDAEAAGGGTDAAKDAVRNELLSIFALSAENKPENGKSIETFTVYAAFNKAVPTADQFTAAAALNELQVVTSVVSTSPNYGTTGAAPVPIFPLTSVPDVTTVIEGSAVTFTVTLNTAALADQTYSFNVNGATNDAITTAATTSGAASDFVLSNGTFTIAAGATTGTFQVTAKADVLVESLEGFKVAILDGSNNLLLNSSILAIQDNPAGGGPGQTFTLTTNVDNIPGLVGSLGTTDNSGDDIIIAGEGSVGGQHTLGSSDVINGGTGTDRINIRLADVAPAALVGQTITPNIAGVEKVFTQAINSVAGGSNAINAINVTGATEWWSDNSTSTLIVNNVNEKAAVGVIGGDDEGTAEADDYQVGFKTSAVTGALTVALQGVVLDDLGVSAQDGVAEFATWDISVTGTANSTINTLTDNGAGVAGAGAVLTSLSTINVSGDKRLTINDVLGGVTTINAGAQTAGGVRVVVDTTKDITFTGGAGTDRVDVGAVGLNLNDKLDGGTGVDTFRISGGAMLTTALAGNVKGFDIFEGRGIGQVYDLDALLPNNTLTEVILNPTSGVASDITVNNIPGTATASIRAVSNEMGTALLTAKDFIQGGTTDTATLILDNSVNKAADGVDIATLNFARVDNLNIQSKSDGTPTDAEINSIAALTAGDLEVITITGDNGVSLTTTATSNAVTKVDASGLTSATTNLTLLTLNLSADVAGEGAEIIGTAQKDIITSTAVATVGKGDNITAGAGSDTVNLSPTVGVVRNNTLNYTAATISTGDLAADTQDTVTGIAIGDRINMTAGVEAQLKVNGLLLSATAANQTLTAAAFDINNNIIAVDKGADRAIQIDLNGDGLFTSTLDFEILLAGRAGTTVQYDATNDYLTVTALGGGGGGGGAVASNTLTLGVDTFNNTTVAPTATFGGVVYGPSFTQNAAVTLFSSAANLQATDSLTFGTGAATLQMQGAVNSATFVAAAAIGGATVTGLDILSLDNVINTLTVSGDYGTALVINGGTSQDVIDVAKETTGGMTINVGDGNDVVTVDAGAAPAVGKDLTINGQNGDDTIQFDTTADATATKVNGGAGIDTAQLAAAQTFTDAAFALWAGGSVDIIQMQGAGGATGIVGINAFAAGINTVKIGTATTDITAGYAGLGTLTIDATNLADNTSLDINAASTGTVAVTNLIGDVWVKGTTANVSVAVANTNAVQLTTPTMTGTLTVTGGGAASPVTVTTVVDGAGAINAAGLASALTITYANQTSDAVTLTAGSGNTTVTGDASDTITVTGLNTGFQSFIGNTSIFKVTAGAGNQTIDVSAAAANSIVTAGTGADSIKLGANATKVVIGTGATGITVATADSITAGFTSGTDTLGLGLAGDATASTGNYVEAGAAVADFAASLTAANVALATLNGTSAAAQLYAFQWDATNGYLFEDTNSDGVADQVIVLVGITGATIAAGDIVA